MTIKMNNPCIRCGKERIVVKTWKENVTGSTVTHTTMSCPDADCQEIVNRQLSVQKEKKEALERSKNERILAKKHPPKP